MRGLLLAALVETGLITWRDLSKEAMLPLPSDYVAVAIFFGGLSLFPESASGFTSTLGWGMVLATFLGLFDPTNPTKLVFPGQAQQAQSAQTLGGSNSSSPSSTTFGAASVPGQPGQTGFGAAAPGVAVSPTGVAQ